MKFFNLVFLIIFLITLSPACTPRPRRRRVDNNLKKEIDEIIKTEAAKACAKERKENTKVENKKNRLLNIGPINFHYINKKLIENFYNDEFREPTIQNFIKNTISSKSNSTDINIPHLLKQKAGETNLTNWIKSIKIPDISIIEKFRRYQSTLIEKNQIIIDLEILDIELTEYYEFLDLVKYLKGRHSFSFDGNSVEQKKQNLKNKAAQKTTRRLENISGWVLVEGNFEIQEAPNESYKLLLTHPVSAYLGQDVTISITISIEKKSLEESFRKNYEGAIGSKIPMVIFGEIFKPLRGNTSEIKITPTAIYGSPP